MKEDIFLDQLEKILAEDEAKATLPGAVAVKKANDSNLKKKERLRSQMYKRKTAAGGMIPNEEQKSSYVTDNEEKDRKVKTNVQGILINNDPTTTIESNIVNEIDVKNHKERLKMKTREDIRSRYSTTMANDISAHENLNEIPTLSSNRTNPRGIAPFAGEEGTPVIPTTINEEGIDFEQSRNIVNESNDNYEMPIAIAVNASEVLLVSPHAEPIDVEEDIVIVEAKVIYFVLL